MLLKILYCKYVHANATARVTERVIHSSHELQTIMTFRVLHPVSRAQFYRRGFDFSRASRCILNLILQTSRVLGGRIASKESGVVTELIQNNSNACYEKGRPSESSYRFNRRLWRMGVRSRLFLNTQDTQTRLNLDLCHIWDKCTRGIRHKSLRDR